MNHTEVHQRVAGVFPAPGRHPRRPRTTRVAVEHELLTADALTGRSVPLDRVRAATARAPYAPYLAFEPGGQVELSLPTAACPVDIERRLRADVSALRHDCAAAGIRLVARPVDRRSEEAVPLRLCSPRYVAMQRHFDSIGPAGRTMMRRTASTQVCLDWWSGRAGAEQWRVLQLTAPFLAAAFARSDGATSRLATWLAVDPTRTAFDDRLLHGDDPIAAYADFAWRAVVFTDPGDVDQHLTTLFPPVRPRGCYLEVRYPDVQDEDGAGRLVATLATLAYDDDLRREVLRRFEPGRAHLGRHWEEAAHGTGDVAAIGRDLVVSTLALTGGPAGSLAAAGGAGILDGAA
ncbi:glutamate-cysteine ligase family protein [Oryzobacter terrae]|uniref:glutamate-cysteine ligase family protein n=1 Tax=Oryzobacter terrae TaxID=1620385 RepID=UPI0036714B0E